MVLAGSPHRGPVGLARVETTGQVRKKTLCRTPKATVRECQSRKDSGSAPPGLLGPEWEVQEAAWHKAEWVRRDREDEQ